MTPKYTHAILCFVDHTKEERWLSPTALANALVIPRATINTQIARGMYGKLEQDFSKRGGPRKFYYEDVLIAKIGQTLLAFYNNIPRVSAVLNKTIRWHIQMNKVTPENAVLLVHYRGRTPAGDTVTFEDGKAVKTVPHASYDNFVTEWIDLNEINTSRYAKFEEDYLAIRVFKHAEWAKKLIESEGRR